MYQNLTLFISLLSFDGMILLHNESENRSILTKKKSMLLILVLFCQMQDEHVTLISLIDKEVGINKEEVQKLEKQ